MRCLTIIALMLLVLGYAAAVRAADTVNLSDNGDLFDSGRLLGTGGVTEVEGQGGGGVVPWALITGYGTRDSMGANGHYSYVYLPNYQIHSFGAATGLFNRVELSYSRTTLDTGATGKALGLGAGYTIRLDTLGMKVKLFGDAIYDQDTWLPQVTAGLQFKANNRGSLLRAIGARGDEGVDGYLAASKLFLSESLLLNATLRMTKANQTGLLGFGGDRLNAYRPQPELSAAYLVTRQIAVGADYRFKPDNLRFAHENNWADVFVAYFFNKHISATLAFVDLGTITIRKNQEGVCASLQIGL